MSAPQNKQDLWLQIWQRFDGLRLPHKTFSPGHSSPFGFVADAFFNPSTDVAAWACRSGGKTLGASILAALEFMHIEELQGRVLSGSEDQAKNLYGYWRHWCEGALGSLLDDGAVKQGLTKINGGRFEILAASQKRVRGPKVNRLFEDELDEIDTDVDTAAVGMIDSARGIPGRTVYTSTWHHADGLMAKLVSECPQNGVRLHRWNLWEAIANCPQERHEGGKGCSHCPLQPTCVGKAREFYGDPDRELGIAADAMGIYQIDDVCKAYQKVGKASWDAEWLCNRPSVEGVVYPDFDAITHRCENPPADLAIYRAIDWGLNVFICLWIGQAKDGTSYVLDTYRAEIGTIHQHIEYINHHRLQSVRATYCDPAGRSRNDQTGKSNIDLFRAAGIPCQYTLSPKFTNIQNGLQLVRAAIRPASGPPKLRYVPNDNNRSFVTAMQSYHNRKVNGVWIDSPQDPQEYEHIPDALRYYIINRERPSGIGRVALGVG